MDKKEFSIFAMALKTTYPKDNLLPNKEAMEIWHEYLKDIPYNLARAFLDKWITSNTWSPTIADIRQGVAELSNEEIADWGQAWEEVERAVSRYGYPRPEEAMASLSPLTRQVVKRLGYQTFCESENPDAMRAHFKSIYEDLARREKQDRCLSDKVKSDLLQIRQKNYVAIEDNSFSDNMEKSYAGLGEKKLEILAGVPQFDQGD